MGRKSRKNCLIKPFCYFCGREFDNEKVLVQHQKAKHFKCTECNRRLETANGLLVHMQQVHKMVQRRVPNALEGRDNISSSIQGMNGVPSEVIEEHRMQHIQKLANLKNQKQQRISWTQINAPGFNNQFMPMTTANNFHTSMPPNVAPMAANLTNGMPAPMSGSMGVPLGAPISGSAGSNVSPTAAAGTTSSVGSAAINVPSESDSKKLLILDAYGMPLSQPAQSAQPADQQPLKQPISLQTNKILYKSNLSGLTNAPASLSSNFSVDATHTGSRFSGFDKPSSNFSSAPASHDNTSSDPPGKDSFSKPLEDSEDSSSHTTFYKATGLQPLYMPTPSLGNTKLSYSSDTVSIEELRAKIKFNWHESQT